MSFWILKRMSQIVQHDGRPPLAIVNKVGQPHVASIMNFQNSHVFSYDGPNMI